MSEGLILASASPVRARLLAAAGVTFRVEPADIDEARIMQAFGAESRDASGCALALAEAKARRIAEPRDGDLVIGADQILVSGDAWLDKPADLAGARAQLRALRGRSHELVTAACVWRRRARAWHAVSRPRLTMRHFSDDFLDEYLRDEGTAILGSVGAYCFEGKGAQLFERIEGDYFAILGLPLLELLGFLRASGVVRS